MHLTIQPKEIKPKEKAIFRWLSKNEKLCYICNRLKQFVHVARDFLIDFIDFVAPLFGEKLQENVIVQLKLKNCEMLVGYDQLMQDHIDQFQKRMDVLWLPENSNETLLSFKNNIIRVMSDSSFDFIECNPFSYMFFLHHKMTKEHRNVAKIVYDISRNGNESKELFNSLTVRHVKLYFNAWINTLNSSIKDRDKDDIRELCSVYKVFQQNAKKDVLQVAHQQQLRCNKDFINLLQIMRNHIKFDVETEIQGISQTSTITLSATEVIALLIRHFLDNETWHTNSLSVRDIEYQDIISLIILADDIQRTMRKCEGGLQMHKDIQTIKIAERIGLIKSPCGYYLLLKIESLKERNSNFSDKDLKDLLLESHIDLDEAGATIELFAKGIHDATRHIEVHFDKLLLQSYVF